MRLPDLNLLPALDALLREESVTGAAARLSVSAPAMSRTLARLRRVTGDPLLVPAGRGLAPTPGALALRPRVEAALTAALGVLGQVQGTEPRELRRTFTLRSDDVVAALLGPKLVTAITEEAPGVTVRFVAEGDEDPAALRHTVDLDIGVLAPQPPEVHTEHLLTDEVVGVVHTGHPLSRGHVDIDRFASVPQVTVSRRGRAHGPVDELLAARGRRRRVALTVPSYTVAAFTALSSDLLALLPRSFAQSCTGTVPLHVVEIPLPLPALEIGLAWHARLHLDGGHGWLRGAVRSAALGQLRGAPARPRGSS